MDELGQLSGPIPANFDAENAPNNEDVSYTHSCFKIAHRLMFKHPQLTFVTKHLD